MSGLRALVARWEAAERTALECAGIDPNEGPSELWENTAFDTDEAENYGAALIYRECADELRAALDAGETL